MTSLSRRVLLASAGGAAFAASHLTSGAAAAATPESTPSVEVLPDRRVTFTHRSSAASDVALVGGWFPWPPDPLPLVQTSPGVWQVTVDPLEPNWYSYHFVVDGVPTRDPGNDVVVPSSGVDTMFMVSGSSTDFMEVHDVPHGTVEELRYPSKVTGTTRQAVVWTPPGHDAHSGRLPLFVLMHGGGGDEWDWVIQGRANVILDNLLAVGRIDPMIVVMPSVMLPGAPGMGATLIPTVDRVPEEILGSLLPAVEAKYKVAPAANKRALAGLSMGGFFTWDTLLLHPGEFAWYGDFSSGYFPDGLAWLRGEGRYLFDNKWINTKTRLHAIYCDATDIAWVNNVGTRALFDDMGVRYDYRDIPGTTGHTWNTWRLYLHDFAPRLF